MSAADFFSALSYPLRSSAALIAMLSFYLLGQLASAAGIFGVWLAIVLIPALFRYLVMLAEARARGRDASPPGIEYFSWVGNLWTLFPAVPLVVFVWAYFHALPYGLVGIVPLSVLMASVFPAMMAVLVITHSPIQSLNPIAVVNLIGRVGTGYLFASVLVIVSVWIPRQLGMISTWIASLVELYLFFAFYAVVGTMLQRDELLDEVEIPDALEIDPEQSQAALQRERTGVLNHAYGFVSRGNRNGGLQHIYRFLQTDPQPAAGWAWFFEQMLRWENTDHALVFAQTYVGELLRNGLNIQAMKIILRARLINDRFRPLPEDMALAIDVAEKSGNDALAEALKRA